MTILRTGKKLWQVSLYPAPSGVKGTSVVHSLEPRDSALRCGCVCGTHKRDG